MSATHELEGQPLWKLTDKQVLMAMRGRGDELAQVKVLESLTRIFAKAAETNPACAAGLHSAIGLTHMFGLGLAPGHEDHPFRNVDKNMTVASIMSGGAQIPNMKEKAPIRTPVGRFVSPFLKALKPRTFDLERHMEGTRTGRVTSDMIDMETHSSLPLAGVDHGTVRSALKSAQNMPRVKPVGKCAVIADQIVKQFQGRSVTIKDVMREIGAEYQDVGNAIAKLLRQGKLEKAGYGVYILTMQAVA